MNAWEQILIVASMMNDDGWDLAAEDACHIAALMKRGELHTARHLFTDLAKSARICDTYLTPDLGAYIELIEEVGWGRGEAAT